MPESATEQDRRRYRFRAWHKNDRQIYSVLMFGRGGLKIADHGIEKTCPLDEVVLMQYTGLTDKGGQGIYETDILQDKQGQRHGVELHDGAFQLTSLKDEQTTPLNSALVSARGLAIVGNIFELS